MARKLAVHLYWMWREGRGYGQAQKLGSQQFERVRYSSSPEHLRALAERLIAHQVEEVVMESTHNIGNRSGGR